MFNEDRFELDLRLGDWLFTLALGLALGLVLAGLWFWFRGPRSKGAAAGLVASGVMGGVVLGLAVYDAGPVSQVYFRIRPYLSGLAKAGALLGALALGAAVSFAIIAGLRRAWSRDLAILPGLGLCALLAVLVLWRLDEYETRNLGRHPIGADTNSTVSVTPVIEGLEVPTGLSFAKNGDLAVIELTPPGLRIYTQADGVFTERLRVPVPIPVDLMAFHVAFHPEWPSQPYLYISAEQEAAQGRLTQLLRAKVEGTTVRFEALLSDIPAGRLKGMESHIGTGIAFCAGYFFLTVGDTEDNELLLRPVGSPGGVRHEALELTSVRGKVLRWRLSGIDLDPAPVAGTDLPIYAFGFRNPFAIACDEKTGFPVIGENGHTGNDQVRLVRPGSNNEWPLSEKRDALRKPWLDTGDVHIAPTGVDIRDAGGGQEVLVAGFQSQAIYLLPVSDSGKPGKLRLITEVESAPFAVVTDERGCIYFSSVDTVWRVDDGRCAP